MTVQKKCFSFSDLLPAHLDVSFLFRLLSWIHICFFKAIPFRLPKISVPRNVVSKRWIPPTLAPYFYASSVFVPMLNRFTTIILRDPMSWLWVDQGARCHIAPMAMTKGLLVPSFNQLVKPHRCVVKLCTEQ